MNTEEYQDIKASKRSHKKKYAITVVCTITCFCLLLGIVGCGIENTYVTSQIDSVSDNLYYDKDTLSERAHKGDEEHILADYRLLSEYLAKTYPQKVFHVDNFNYSIYINDTNEDVQCVRYMISQMIEGAVVDDTSFPLDVGDNKVRDYDYAYENYIGEHPREKFIQDVPKSNKKISVEEAVRKAKKIAKENEDVMHHSVSDVECSYKLKYNTENGYYYLIHFGSNGCLGGVAIDAETGEVLWSKFSDGLITLSSY